MSNNWQKVETIIDRALELPDDERRRFIKQQCGEDTALEGEVTLLLRSIFASDGWLEDPGDYKKEFYEGISDDVELLRGSHSLLGKQVGAYTIQEKIGEGGMGAVYMAKRSDGAFAHRVAIKIIRQAKATPQNIQRFRQEQRILAGLNHPGIARLFDGGVTGDGFPYIIMEYVEGTPIDAYCRAKNCSLADKVDLFKKVLQALRYAHENLVIHRDLKPANILVDAEGNIKILDFGISKLLQEDEELSLTQTGARLLTPRYAAPEQIRQQNSTTATDLYALGVVFYELLAGAGPFELHELSRYQMEQTILQAEPPKPSSKTASETFKKHLQGDLDAIALKAIRKEPDKRYRVANEFLDDLEHYQQNLPVSARLDTTSYRTGKFFKRHRQGVAVAGGLLLLVIGFAIFYSYNITRERNQAQIETKKANEIVDFLIDLFKTNEPNSRKGDTLTAQKLLKMGEHRVDLLNGQPAVQSNLLEVLGNIYGLLSNFQKADSLQRMALAINKNIYDANSPELASIYGSLAATTQNLGKYSLSVGLNDTSLAYNKNIYGPASKEVGKSLALQAETLSKMGKLDSAYQVILQSKKIFHTIKDTLSSNYLETLMELGPIEKARGNLKESEQYWRKSLQLSKNLYEPPNSKIDNNITGLADVLKELEKFSEAESLYIQSLKMGKKLYGKTHINIATTLNNLAGIYYYTEKYEKADSLYSRSYDMLTKILGPTHPSVISTLYNQANLNLDIGQFDTAEVLFKKVLKSDKKVLGVNHPNIASDYASLGSLYKKEKKYSLAITYFNKSLKIRRSIYDEDHPYIAYNERSLAQIMVEIKKFDQAEKFYLQSFVSMLKTFDKNSKKIKGFAEEYANFLATRGKNISPDSLISLHIKK